MCAECFTSVGAQTYQCTWELGSLWLQSMYRPTSGLGMTGWGMHPT
jgi:hypothetical protein